MAIPRVSIIIPVFNAEEVVVETLTSAVNQTWPNMEIIVVDDGSADSSFEIARAFKSQKVKVYRKKNEGAAAARNYGLGRATGEYIQYLDADDLMSPNKIESQIAILEKQPEGYICSCAWGKFDESPEEAWFETQEVFGDFAPVDWLTCSWEGGGMMQTACWLVPRYIAESAGQWNEKLSLHDDGEYFARILLASKGVKFCKDALVYYRRSVDGSLSRQRSRRAVESAFNVCESYRESLLFHENSVRVRHALMMNYLRFIYEYHPHYGYLTNLARQRVQQLGFQKLPPHGGKKFKLLARCLGFDNALRMRALFKSKCNV
jgi:glycosyltransferase involved in cell wall biosynthesis